MLSIDEIIKNITNSDEEIKQLINKRVVYFESNDKLIEANIKQQKIYKMLSNTKNIEDLNELVKIDQTIYINYIQIQELQEKIKDINKEIKDLLDFKNANKDWEGGKYPGTITNTLDGCRIRFDGQSRSFKFENYINIDTTIICESKEDCLSKAKKYLYDYYNILDKITNQYRFIHPKFIQVKLSCGQTFITNSKYIDIIEKNIIGVKYEKKYNNYYVNYINESKEYNLFYKLISNYSKVKYLNGQTLDLRDENLKEADNAVLAKLKVNKEIIDKTKLNKDGYPYNTWILGKYAGTVFQRANKNTWSVVIQKEDKTVVTKTLTFNESNKEEMYNKAIEIRNDLSEQYDLTKNKIRIIDGDIIEVKLTKDQIMKTDYKFLDIIQKYPIFSSKGSKKESKYYAGMEIDGKSHRYHNYITGFEMTDHIDRDPLNNCISNLRECDHKINNNNRSKSESSNAIVLGVTYCESSKSFRARIKQDDKETTRYFSIEKYGYELAKQMAIDARQEFNKIFNCNNG
jgi:hypothetical protein